MVAKLSSSASPNSADIVDDLERRITTEINQLVCDIRRIEPVGESWCTFGDLFMDPAVQEFYEALVIVLKSAKRKGVISFKGQMLLKGMSDKVKVTILSSGGDDGTAVPSLESENRVSIDDKDEDVVGGSSSSNNGNGNGRQEKRAYRNHKKNQKSHSQRMRKTPISFSTRAGNNLQLSMEKDNITPLPKKKSGAKLDKLFQSNSSRNHHHHNENRDSGSVVSVSTAPVSSSTNVLTPEPRNSDVSHFNGAGTTFQSKAISESHSDRVAREIEQLVVDIRRIEPKDESSCTFGELFDDPQVEQYYEALVGTLKAARRKGVIAFKGQMLLKGMHDRVLITIVE